MDDDNTPLAPRLAMGLCTNPDCRNIHLTPMTEKGKPMCYVYLDFDEWDAMVARIQAERYARSANRD